MAPPGRSRRRSPRGRRCHRIPAAAAGPGPRRRDAAPAGWRSGAFERLQPSRSDRLRERLIAKLVLVGIALGEVADRPVELVVLTRYSAIATGSPERAWARARVQP